MGKHWTQDEIEFVRQNAGKISLAQIARTIGRTPDSMCHLTKRYGIANTFTPVDKTPWTEQEIATLRRDYRRLTTTQVAQNLGRERKQVFNKAFALGLCVIQKIRHPELAKLVVRRHAQGWSDSEVAAEFGCERHTVGNVRHKLGLPSNAVSQHRRDRVRAATLKQCAAAGVSTLGALRSKIYAGRSVKAGWPAGLRPRAVEILDLLWAKGPHTRREIADALGIPWNGSHKSLISNDPEGSYLAHLAAVGLVQCLGRLNRVVGQGTGKSTSVYTLTPWAEKQQTIGVDHG